MMEPREGQVPEMRHAPFSDRRRQRSPVGVAPAGGDNVIPALGLRRGTARGHYGPLRGAR